MTLEPGTSFGPCRILGLLGAGGMASVYRAFQPSLRREVAIKVIGAHLSGQKTFEARFRREAEVLARLEHPNILPVFDYGQQDGQAYIVYRFISGGTLWDLLLGDRLPVADVVRLLVPVAAALDFAHTRGVVHRDIKPSNILLTEEQMPIVADFGLARILDTEADASHAGEPLTQVAVGIGTPAYMAPEQIRGSAVDGRADQYALGIVAYQMLTGAVPFAAQTPEAVMAMHLYEPVPMPRSRNRAISPAAEQALLKALARDPADRYPTCAAFMAAMQAAEEGIGPVTSFAVPEDIDRTLPLQLSPGMPSPKTGDPDSVGLFVRSPMLRGSGAGVTTDRDFGSEPSSGGIEQPRGAGQSVGMVPVPAESSHAADDAPTLVTPPPNRLDVPHVWPRGAPRSRQQPAVREFEAQGRAVGKGQDSRRRLVVLASLAAVVVALIGGGVIVKALTSGPGPKPAPIYSGEITPAAGSLIPATTAASVATPGATSTAPLATQTATSTAPAATQTTTPSVPPPAPPLPATVLAADNFSDPVKGILDVSSSSETRYRRAYVNGDYVISVLDPTYETIPEATIPNDYDDATLAIDVRMAGRADDRHVVLGCRYSDTNTGYRLWVDMGAGTYRLFRMGEKEPIYLKPRDNPSPAILVGTVSNHLALTCAGTTITVSINGTKVAQVQDATWTYGQFLFGASNYSGTGNTVEAHFNNLLVTRTPANAAPVLVASTLASADQGVLGTNLTSSDGGRFFYAGGEYVIQKTQPQGGGRGWFLFGQYADTGVTIDARLTGDLKDRYIQVGCRVLDSGGYEVLVLPDRGSFLLLRVDGGTGARLIDDTVSAAIHRGSDYNRVTLTCSGDTLTVVINGMQVGRVQDSTYRSGRIYLGAGGDSLTGEGRFRNLVVTQQ